jgi:hypothetical protein
MPSTLLSIAFWIKVDWSGICPELEYLNSTLSFAAASCAPFLITSKNASPSGAWLIIAKVRRGKPFAAGPLWLAAPPLLLHAAVASANAAATTTRARRLRDPNIVVPLVCSGLGSVGPGIAGGPGWPSRAGGGSWSATTTPGL